MGNVVKIGGIGATPTAVIGNFSSADDRQRLTKTALKAFMALCESWAVADEVALELSGLDEDEWKMVRSPEYTLVLNQDQLTRVSALVGAFKGLNLLFADGFANKWPTTKNSGPLFGGATPVELMLAGGIPMMLKVRGHIDALRGGI
ncbi:MAG: DUF2384 domain-containing protein [Hyphomonadaceae bacterium]